MVGSRSRWSCNQKWHYGFVEMDWQRFGEKISEVVHTFTPGDKKLLLFYSIANPVKLHVDGFSLLGSNSI